MKSIRALIVMWTGLAVWLGVGGAWGATTNQDMGLPAILEQVSADAPLVVVVPSLSGLNQKLAGLGQSLGVPIPQLADGLGQVKQKMGLTQGVDDNGSLAVVFASAQGLMGARQAGGKPPVVLLIPVSDHAVFMGNFPDAAESEQGVTAVTLQDGSPGGSPGFVKQRGGYAVLGPTEELVRAYAPADGASSAIVQQVGKVGVRALGGSDASLIVNVQAIAPVIQPVLDAGLAQMASQLDAEAAGQGMQASARGLAQTFVSIYSDVIRAALRDTSAVVISLDVSDLGVGLRETAQFKRGSYLASLFTDGGGAGGHLQRLADRPYLTAMAVDLRGIAVGVMVDALMARLPAEGAIGPISLDLIKQYGAMVRPLKAVASAYFVPSPAPGAGAMGAGLLQGVAIYQTDDADAYRKGTRAYLEAMNQIQIPLGSGSGTPSGGGDDASGEGDQGNAGDPGVMTFNCQYNAGVMEVDGVSVDQYQAQVNFPPEVMQEMGPAMPFLMMLGMGGQTGHIAASGSYVVATVGPDPALIKEALGAIKQGGGMGGGSSTIQQVRDAGFPRQPSMETYLSVSGLAASANMVMTMMGQSPIQVPEGVPPIGMAVNLEGSGLAARVFVPMRVIEFGRDTAMQMMMQGAANGQQPSPEPSPEGELGQSRQGPPPAPR